MLTACSCRADAGAAHRRRPVSGAGPVIVVETTKGTFAFETFPDEAPKTVAHVVALVRRGFYDGQRVHRAIPGFLVQWGDPQIARSREGGRLGTRRRGVERQADRRRGNQKKRMHVKGAVGMAHPGRPGEADSQIYVTLRDRPDLDGYYTVFGRVIAGDDVPATLQRGDVITRMYVKAT